MLTVDTRKKIVSAREGQKLQQEWTSAGRPVQVVAGYFDPVISGVSVALDNLRIEGGRLMVLVQDPPDPILPARARAELVAALGSVDAVVTESADVPFDAWVDMKSDHLQRRADFIEHVRRRNAG